MNLFVAAYEALATTLEGIIPDIGQMSSDERGRRMEVTNYGGKNQFDRQVWWDGALVAVVIFNLQQLSWEVKVSDPADIAAVRRYLDR